MRSRMEFFCPSQISAQKFQILEHLAFQHRAAQAVPQHGEITWSLSAMQRIRNMCLDGLSYVTDLPVFPWLFPLTCNSHSTASHLRPLISAALALSYCCSVSLILSSSNISFFGFSKYTHSLLPPYLPVDLPLCYSFFLHPKTCSTPVTLEDFLNPPGKAEALSSLSPRCRGFIQQSTYKYLLMAQA